MTMQMFSTKTKCTNNFTRFKLIENSQFQIFNNIHTYIRSDQPIFRLMENTGKTMISYEKMPNDDNASVFIQNKLQQ